VPRLSITAVTSPTTIAITAPKYHRLTPAANITIPPPATSITEVPRSGCISTSAVGSRISTTGISTHSGRETFSTGSQS